MTVFDTDAKCVEKMVALHSDPYDIMEIKKHMPGVLALYSKPFKAEVFKYRNTALNNFVIVKRDIHGLDGRLRVERGAIGVISSYDRGDVGVLFDDTPHFVKLDGSGQRHANVSYLYITLVWQHLLKLNCHT